MAREKAGVQRDRDRNSSSFAAVARKRRMHPGCCGMEGKMGIQVYNSRLHLGGLDVTRWPYGTLSSDGGHYRYPMERVGRTQPTMGWTLRESFDIAEGGSIICRCQGINPA